MSDYISSNGLSDPYQSAYTKAGSTETALACVQNDILRAIDNQQAGFLLMLDLSAAFDTMDHGILLHMNFRGELKHPCRHDAQNDSEVRKITHSFSMKKINLSTTIYSFFSLLRLIERYLSPFFNEVIFRFKKKNILSWHFCLNGTQVCIFFCVILWFFQENIAVSGEKFM